MECIDTQNLLAEYLGSELDQSLYAKVQVHLDTCEDCRVRLQQRQALCEALRQMPVEAPYQGFAEQALLRAREAHREDTAKSSPGFRHWFVTGFGGALAAGLALWAVFSLLLPVQVPTALPSVNVALNQTRSVRLVFSVPDDIDSVTLTVQLPENFELAGYPGKHSLAWKTRLKKGRNVLSLPVIAITSGKGQLVARVARKQKSKTFRVRLNTDKKEQTSQRATRQAA